MAEAERGSTVLSKAAENTSDPTSRLFREAVRRAPRPSVSGFCFELMGLAWVAGGFLGMSGLSYALRGASSRLNRGAPDPPVSTSWFDIARIVNSPPAPERLLVLMLVFAPIVFLSVRIAAGLARIASEGSGQRGSDRFVRAWRLGGATQFAAFGVWVQVAGMMAAATAALLLPLAATSRLASQHSALVPLHVVLSGLGASFAVVFGAGLGAVQELSMASLGRHERGVGSAVLHAWRMVRSQRSISRRMSFAEATSRVVEVAVASWLALVAGPWVGISALVLAGALIGGIRSQAWSLAYPRLGGI